MDRTFVLHMIIESFRFDFKVLTHVLKKYTLEISFILLFFSEKAFFLTKLGWLIHFLHDTGVFVLVFPLSYYYSIILMESLAFFPP